MRKENIVNKNKCFPGGLLSGVSRLYSRLVNKETSLFYQQHISGRSRIKCKMTPNFMSGLHLTYKQHGGFTLFPAPISRIETLRDDEARCGGFSPSLVIPVLAVREDAGYSAGYKSGFTLIELLVVVLIIGILAAVALPQYQKAVEKSKATQALTMLKSVYQAAEAYKMANGDYPTQFDELAVEIPWTGTQQVDSSQLADKRSNGEWTLELFNNGSIVYLASGRLTGKYKGAHFRVSLQDTEPKKLGGKIRCFERTDQTIPFTAPAGSYCKQIMKGECEFINNMVLAHCYLP